MYTSYKELRFFIHSLSIKHLNALWFIWLFASLSLRQSIKRALHEVKPQRVDPTKRSRRDASSSLVSVCFCASRGLEMLDLTCSLEMNLGHVLVCRRKKEYTNNFLLDPAKAEQDFSAVSLCKNQEFLRCLGFPNIFFPKSVPSFSMHSS